MLRVRRLAGLLIALAGLKVLASIQEAGKRSRPNKRPVAIEPEVPSSVSAGGLGSESMENFAQVDVDRAAASRSSRPDEDFADGLPAETTARVGHQTGVSVSAGPQDSGSLRPLFWPTSAPRLRLVCLSFGIIFLALATLWISVADPPKPYLAAQTEIPAPTEAAPPARPTSVAISELPFRGELHEPQSSRNLRGVPEIVDTSTLILSGKIVRLFGVRSGGKAENLKRYLAGRPVACTPSGRAHTFHCQVDGRDISEMVLFNGAGRANEDATPQLRAAENGARAQRIGVWSEPWSE